MGEEELKIQDKPLSQWMAQLRGENRGFQMRAARALIESPTNARPKIIEQVIPQLENLAKWQITPELRAVSDRLHEEAAKACAAIGEEGKAAPVGNDRGDK